MMGGIVESSAIIVALGGGRERDQAGGTGYVCYNFCYWYFLLLILVLLSFVNVIGIYWYILLKVWRRYPPRAEEEERDHAGVTR